MSYLADEEEREKKRASRRICRQQIIEHVKKSLLYTAFDIKWVPDSAAFVSVGQYPSNHGAISVYKLNKGELITVAEVKKKLPIKCCTFGHLRHSSGSTVHPRTLGTGDFSGGLQLWDIERPEDDAIWEAPRAHTTIINSVDGALFSGPPEIATGSRDGGVKVWDTRQQNKPVVALLPTDPARARDCWTVRLGGCHDVDERLLCAGYDNGDVKLFDLRTQRMLHEFNAGNGVCDVEFDRPDIAPNKLLVSSLEGRLRSYDLRTLHPKFGYAYVEERVSNGTVWCTKALPQNREVFISGGGGELTLCCYQYPPDRSLKDADGIPKGVAGSIEELNKVKFCDQPVNSLDWNRSKEGLLACSSFDQAVRVFLVTRTDVL